MKKKNNANYSLSNIDKNLCPNPIRKFVPIYQNIQFSIKGFLLHTKAFYSYLFVDGKTEVSEIRFQLPGHASVELTARVYILDAPDEKVTELF